ncbi:alkaline phosphatase D family protein [Planctomycetota bacterium]
MKKTLLRLSIIAMGLTILTSCQTKSTTGPYFATGIKIGEVTQADAIVWVRLTENADRVGNDAPMPDIKYRDPVSGELIERKGRPNLSPVVTYPGEHTIKTIQGACPGTQGKVRLKYKEVAEKDWMLLDWQTVDPGRACTTQFNLSGLVAGKKYVLLVEASPAQANRVSAVMEGEFKTAPAADVPAKVNFIVTTGTSYPDVDSENGYKLYPNSLNLDPEFFVHTGDIVYYDNMGKSADLARWHWDRMYSYPNNIEYHRQVASYFIKDDHDTWMDDAYPGMKTKFMGEFTFEEGQQIFLDEVPMGDKTYRTIRWGQDLQIWLVEGRDYRSQNIKDDGPDKTIWGENQKAWFTSTVEASDATFKLLISPTPIVGPDRVKKNDNHANTGFKYEGDVIRKFISQQKNMYVVCGDRHWQYISRDLETGVMEFSSGPGSDAHAGGWSQENKLPEHIYLNVVGGFMEVEVSRHTGEPKLIIRHYDPDGTLLNEYVVEAS